MKNQRTDEDFKPFPQKTLLLVGSWPKGRKAMWRHQRQCQRRIHPFWDVTFKFIPTTMVSKISSFATLRKGQAFIDVRGGGGGSEGPSRAFWHHEPPSPNKSSAVSRTIDALFGDDRIAASRRRPVHCLGQWARVETMAQTMAQPFKLAIRSAINRGHYLSCFFFQECRGS